jgi:hypothetical protein
VAVHQAFDYQLSCTQLLAEMQNNEQRALAITKEREASRGRNVAVGIVGGLLFWPALFALDVTDTERVELEALSKRNDKLSDLVAQRCDPGTMSIGVQVVEPGRTVASTQREQLVSAPTASAISAVAKQETGVDVVSENSATGTPWPAACARYSGDQARWVDCVVLTSPDGPSLIPAVGRSASLDSQVRCHRFRMIPDQYSACLEGANQHEPAGAQTVAHTSAALNVMGTPGSQPAETPRPGRSSGVPVDEQAQCEPIRGRNPALWALCRSVAGADRARIVPAAGLDAPLGARLACQAYAAQQDLYGPCLARNASRTLDSFH